VRVSLSLRIFLVSVAFTVASGLLALVLVRQSFHRYYQRWERSLATLPSEQVFDGSASEIARSLLLRLEREPEVKERDQDRIAQGLNAILREIPSISSFLVLDRDRRIQYANQPSAVDLTFTGGENASLFASDQIVRRTKPSGTGGTLTEVMIPIFDEPPAGQGERRRLGSLIIDYAPDAALVARIPQLRPPSVSPRDSMLPLFAFLLAGVCGGILVAGLTAIPVRRLDRALRDFRERGFRGGIDAKRLGLGGELASAVSAINEMGGRLEALDSRGREREALLATLSQSLEEGMIAIDERQVPVAWNAAALRILGLPPQGADDAAMRAALDRHPELSIGWSAGSVHPPRSVEITREGGESVPVQLTEVPFEPRPGASGTLVLLRDLATLRKVEAHLLEAGRFAVLAHLAGSLAHEIRNPLHSIGLNAGVVQQYVGQPVNRAAVTAMSESLRTIQEETRRLTDLLNNYLGLLRSAPEPVNVDVREVCRRVIQLLSYAAMKARVEIKFEGNVEVPSVFGVPDRLQQAVLNLVLNAIQAMPHGGRVALQATEADGLVRVSVTDTGPGLPQDLAEQLFDTRVTTKPGGSGLGLPLVRMIAEAHGGSVWYRSDPGKGATFTLVLPSAREAA
jgi:signal transduction histidine kinase